MVHGQVGEHLAVDLDTSLMKQAHQLRVRETLQTSGSVDTLNPQGTEDSLLGLTVTVCLGQTLLPSILGNGPNVLSCTKVTSGQLQNFLSSCSRSNVIYWSWHSFLLFWMVAPMHMVAADFELFIRLITLIIRFSLLFADYFIAKRDLTWLTLVESTVVA